MAEVRHWGSANPDKRRVLFKLLALTGDTPALSQTPFATGDIQISKDRGAFVDISDLVGVAEIGGAGNGRGWYWFTLTEVEMQAREIIIDIQDQAGNAWLLDAVLFKTGKVGETGALFDGQP